MTKQFFVSIDNETGAELHEVEISDELIEAGEDYNHAWEQCGEPQCLLTLEEWNDAVKYIAEKVKA